MSISIGDFSCDKDSTVKIKPQAFCMVNLLKDKPLNLHNNYMTVGQAVALRIKELLAQHKMTIYKLEQNSGVLHGTMSCILYGRSKTVTLTTLIQIANGFGIPYREFLNSPLLDENNLDIE